MRPLTAGWSRSSAATGTRWPTWYPAPWHDCEGLFRPGRDFLYAGDEAAMTGALRRLLAEPKTAAEFARADGALPRG